MKPEEYVVLADWINSRWGQSIVCENEGAAWLDGDWQSAGARLGFKSSFQVSKAVEIYCEKLNPPQEPQQLSACSPQE
jgi:hypothetical protein